MKNFIKYFIISFIYVFLYCSSYQETENIKLKEVKVLKQQEIESNQENIKEIHKNKSEKKESIQEDQNNQNTAIPEENQKNDLSEIPKTENITQTKEEKNKTQGIADSKEKEKIDIEKMILEDRKLIETIKDNIEQFRESSEDTTALKNKKQKQFAQKVKEINKKYIGKTLTFQYLYLENVKPEQELTPYGRQKIAKFEKEKGLIQKFILGLELLANCEGCYRETGRYKAELYLAELKEYEYSNQINVDKDYHNKIILIITNESKALEHKKGHFYSISGKVESINIYDSKSGIETIIYLK